MPLLTVCSGDLYQEGTTVHCEGEWYSIDSASLLQQSGVTLEQIFQYPLAPDLATAWMAGFGLPITLYLVSWAYGVVVNFFRPEHEHE